MNSKFLQCPTPILVFLCSYPDFQQPFFQLLLFPNHWWLMWPKYISCPNTLLFMSNFVLIIYKMHFLNMNKSKLLENQICKHEGCVIIKTEPGPKVWLFNSKKLRHLPGNWCELNSFLYIHPARWCTPPMPLHLPDALILELFWLWHCFIHIWLSFPPISLYMSTCLTTEYYVFTTAHITPTSANNLILNC